MSDAELNQFLFERKCLTKLNLNACLAERSVMQVQALPFSLCKLSGSCTALQNTNVISQCGISILPSMLVADFSRYIKFLFHLSYKKPPTTITKSRISNADSDDPQAPIPLGINEEQWSNGKINTPTMGFSYKERDN